MPNFFSQAEQELSEVTYELHIITERLEESDGQSSAQVGHAITWGH